MKWHLRNCLVLSAWAPYLAFAGCDDKVTAWVHLDAVNQQNIICPEQRVSVYKVSRQEGERWVEDGERYACGKPRERPGLRYTFDHTEYSQVPFYSYPAMECMDRKIENLERQLQQLRMQLQRR